MQPQLLFKTNGDVILHLPGKAYKPFRTIGAIKNEVFYTTRNSAQNQKYNRENTLAFCYALIAYHKAKFNLVCVNFDGELLWSSPEALMHFGKLKHYSKPDLELQIHLPYEKFRSMKETALRERSEILTELAGERLLREATPAEKPQCELFKTIN